MGETNFAASCSVSSVDSSQLSLRSPDETSETTQLMEQSTSMPSSPPPSYEHVLAESRLADDRSQEQMVESGSSRGCEEPTVKKREEVRGREIIHKSSKELYKAIAAQWGITCKMSDHCRCLDCQVPLTHARACERQWSADRGPKPATPQVARQQKSRYFDCEYDRDNDQEKTDGGLGAGTPMFISEVMHGTACTIL